MRSGGVFETLKYDHGVTALQFDTRKIVAATGENGIKVYYAYRRHVTRSKRRAIRYITVLPCNILRCGQTDTPDRWTAFGTWIVTSRQAGATQP